MNVKYICVFILIFIHCLHNVVCFAHVDTGRKFIAAPSIPIVNDIKKSPVSDLQEYFCTFIFQGFPHLIFYSQVYLESLTFTIVSLEKNYIDICIFMIFLICQTMQHKKKLTSSKIRLLLLFSSPYSWSNTNTMAVWSRCLEVSRVSRSRRLRMTW